MTIRDIVVAFGFEVNRNSEKQAENSIKGIKSMATKLLGAVGVVFSIKGMADLAETAANADALKSQFTQVFGEMEQEASNKLNVIADNTGIAVNRMKGSFVQIAAFAKTTGMETADAMALSDRAMQAVADSAAFYDRAMEDVTDSLQSFLKGNFEQDAALGLSCTEVTRNTAANALYGKSFKDLAEDQKQLTLLKMVEDANKASGALGQAARESDTWTNQLGNLKQSLTDLKAAAGSTFLKPAVSVLKLLTSLVQKATVGIQNLTSENGFLTKATERYHALVKRLKPAVDRMTQTLSLGLSKGIDVVKGVIEKLGGIEQVLKIAAIAAGAFLIAMNWSKIISGAKLFIKLISGIWKLFSLANLKILAVVAIIIILALIVEDFINFLMGNDSVIGTIFDKMGIGAENARQAIFDVFGKIKDFLLEVWDFLKIAASMWIDTVKGFFEKHGESIRANFERAWGIVKTFLEGVWTFLSELAATLFGNTESAIDGSTKSTKDKLLGIWQNILDTLSAVWDALYEAGSAIFNAIATVIETVFSWIQTFWANWGSQILSWFKVLWDNIGSILNAFLEIIKGVANFISSVFTGDWQGAWDAIKQIFQGVWDAMVAFITAIWETIKLVFSMALEAIKAVWESIWNAICNFFQGIWNGIVSFFQGVIDTIIGVITPIAEFFINIFQSAWDGICSVFSGVASFFQGVWDSIVSIFTSIGTAISDAISGAVKGAINAVLRGAAGIINGFIKAINFAIGIINAIPGVSISKLSELSVPQLAEGGIATEATKAIVGEGSEPEAIMPLSKLGGMISSYIKEARGDNSESGALAMLQGVVGKLTEGVSAFTRAATANPSTAANATTNNKNSSVTQHVEINNSYTGGSEETQRNVSKAMKKSAVDATTQMARSLAYTRG